MLSSLKIENVAVIAKTEIMFEDGLNILTGETGAGKSIVIDSINAILGERISKDIVRTGESIAKVTAFFENISCELQDILTELEIESESDNSLLINRTINVDGRSSCRVNGQLITASMLKTIGRELISICGQHDSQHLLSTDYHNQFIKSLADDETQLHEYKVLYASAVTLNKKINALKTNAQDKEQQLDFLKFQIEELAQADIKIGEKDELMEEKNKILNKEKIITCLSNTKLYLDGTDESQGVVSSLYNLGNLLQELSTYDENFKTYLDSVNDLQYSISDCSSAVSGSLDEFDNSYDNLDEIEQRLDVIYKMCRKYGGDEEAVLEHFEKIKAEFDALNFSDEMCENLESELQEKLAQIKDSSIEITKRRKDFALNLQEKVQAELAFLDMPNAKFEIKFTQTSPKHDGADEIEFMFSANSGQELKPLAKIASGGELSRVMLAMKCVLSDFDIVGTMIFDEIDMGVSGRAAQKIAYKLKQVSAQKQVICVTHLAQIASHADNHLLIEKTSDETSTYTNVVKIDDEKRVMEIARIIGGDIITDSTLSSAQELIKFANIT